MVKIITRPLSIEGLKVYKEKSPSKWKDKFGDLDLDNIPQEYMRKGMFPKIRQDGTVEYDNNGKMVEIEMEYFDAVQYRKDRIKGGKLMNQPAQINPNLGAPKAEPYTPPAPDLSPSHIGEMPQ